jgi:2-polyprenyl-3-methyl-5-hydroxy-6-metoxy-1,4-benzoquinol methylase
VNSQASRCPACDSGQTTRMFHKSFGESHWYLAKCKSCAQQFTDPCPTMDDIKGFYSNSYHSPLCSPGKSEEIFGPKFDTYLRWVLKFVQKGRSLDLGCSTGLFPYLLQKRGFQAEGLEINPATAQWGQQHYGVQITSKAFEEADYLPETFSLVTLTDFLEHTPAPFEALHRVGEILQPNKFAFVTFPDIESIESRYFRMLASATKREWLWSNCHIPLHTWEFTRKTAETLFKRAGFRVVGFRRSHPAMFESSPLYLALLSCPSKILEIPYLAERLGTQMEFMLQKDSDVGKKEVSASHHDRN